MTLFQQVQIQHNQEIEQLKDTRKMITNTRSYSSFITSLLNHIIINYLFYFGTNIPKFEPS